ncbi:MAG: MBL fold metallo-hydrolase [Lachnospiraceae bacterium]|nr:MBL fold metallo-hydrolase [Lachnospiraceae bacterium]
MKKDYWKKYGKIAAGFLLFVCMIVPPLCAAAMQENETTDETESSVPEETGTQALLPDESVAVTQEPVSIEPADEPEPESTVPETAVVQEEAALYETSSPGISYTTHVQSYGWGKEVSDGAESGTTGQAKRLEAIQIRLDPVSALSGSVEYRTHVQTYGWLGWVKDGAVSGTTGQAKRLEAIQIRLTGTMAEQYDIYYQVHCQSFGWSGWAKNGAPAGSMGYAKRLEAIQICLVKKGEPAPGDVGHSYWENLKVVYQTHVQTYGWQKESANGQLSGTTGQAKRLEGIKIRLENHFLTEGSVEYRTHVQTYGWQGWVKDGIVSGTTGQAKRLEAIQIRLTGAMAEQYDIYYRVHCQTFGWTGWAKNGAPAGSEGYAKRLEGIEIRLVKKGGSAPGPVNKTYFKKADSIKITQYGKAGGRQLMCYTLEDQKGNLAIIDGGYEADASMLREIIRKHGNRVNAWIITHPHPDHVGAFNAILSSPEGIQIDQIYTVPVNYNRYQETAQGYDEFKVYETFLSLTKNLKNIHYVSENEEFKLLGLDFKVLHGWDETTDQLDVNLCNNGSMVFVLKGKQEKMLFLSDMENETEAYILDRHKDELNADYIQAGHHGNWGPTLDFYAALSPGKVFMDAPDWLFWKNSIYDAHLLKDFFTQRGIPVVSFSTAPNEILIH